MALSSLPTLSRSGAHAVVPDRRIARQAHPGNFLMWCYAMADSEMSTCRRSRPEPFIDLFASVSEAKLLAEQRRIEYSAYRPHSALPGGTSLEVLQHWKAA